MLEEITFLLILSCFWRSRRICWFSFLRLLCGVILSESAKLGKVTISGKKQYINIITILDIFMYFVNFIKQKIDELYEFLKDSSHDLMVWKINSREKWGEFERWVPLFIFMTSSFHGKVKFLWTMFLCHLGGICRGVSRHELLD